MTEQDMYDAEGKLDTMSLQSTIEIMREVHLLHQHDQNFPHQVLEKVKFFIGDEDVLANPERHSDLIREMKLDEGDAVPAEEEKITPQSRLANLKALLQKPKAA